MKRFTCVFFVSIAALVGCEQQPEPPAKPLSESVQPGAPPSAPRGLRGKVIETMDSGGYTYVQLEAANAQKVWAAGPVTPVEVGDSVAFEGGMVMKDFRSKTLDRSFETIYFVNRFEVPGAGRAASQEAGSAGAEAAAPAMKVERIEKASGGMTVAEIFAQSDSLVGKKVKLRGKVVKYNGGIMGRNWLHVQDGSGDAGTNDLTVTTDATAEVGDVVVVEGVLAADKDFGAGYSYPLIVEDAEIEK